MFDKEIKTITKKIPEIRKLKNTMIALKNSKDFNIRIEQVEGRISDV